jgi:4'-phosphopantetheinyl transferase
VPGESTGWDDTAGASGAGRQPPVVLARTTHEVREELGRPEALLSDMERQRATQFRLERHRHDFVAAHALVRVCVARFSGRPLRSIGIAQRCSRCGQATHGRPYVVEEPELYVSWSHTQGYVAAAAADVPVGVDVECERRAPFDPALLATVLTAAEARTVRDAPRPEAEFLHQWVRKECLVKLGRATLDTMGDVDTGAPPTGSTSSTSHRWRTWSGGLHGLDWFDAEHGAVGAACADLSAISPVKAHQ